MPGTLLGRYEVLAPIAAGGMARVWAARQKGSRGFSKTVAIKTLRPDVSDDVRFEQMFLDEARIASRIRHANVVSILDLGEEQNLLYLVMEYIDGEPLIAVRRAAAKSGIPLRLALKIIADSAAGLHAAHQLRNDDGALLGLVHRDVSPQNILISYDGAVKVTDFGIAKAAGRTSETTQRTLKGKPAYMAPEQLDERSVDRRADIFALGIVLYQLVCGVHPFRGENDLATVKNILSERPIRPPSVVNPAVDDKLEAVVMRALERDPEQRFQTAAELEHAIDDLSARTRRARDDELATLMESLLGEHGRERRRELERAMALADERSSLTSLPSTTSGTPIAYASVAPKPRPWRPLAAGLLALAALAIGAFAALALLKRQPTPQPTPSAAAPPVVTLTPVASADPTPVPTPSASPTPTPPPARPPPPPAPPPPSASAPPPEPAVSTPRKKGPVPVMDPGF